MTIGEDKMFVTSRIASAMLNIVLAAVTLQCARADEPVQARTQQGVVIGLSKPSGDVFLGIPFAKPPIGQLRFSYPVAPAVRYTSLMATTPAPQCLQPASAFVAPEPTSESCLTLDIYRPAHHAGRLPVMVWIYGGGFTTGGSSSYDGSALANSGNVIVVAINYRLGAFGFLASSALAARNGGHTGNFGLADQTEAFGWIRKNIGFFGGNASNVTIFGESAGGISACDQIVSPSAKGLFDAAISQSGFCGANQMTLAAAEPASDLIVAELGCASTGDVAACLRKLPAAKILGVSPTGSLGGGFAPVIDGAFLPLQFNDAIKMNRFNHVPTIIGGNHDEGTLFAASATLFLGQPVTAAGYATLLQSIYGAAVQSIAKIYPLSAYQSPTQAYSAVLGDSTLLCPISTSERELAQHVPVYAYEYNEPDPPIAALGLPSFPDFSFGDAHGLDVGYLFPNLIADTVKTAKFDSLSREFMLRWSAFAWYRTPNRTISLAQLWVPYVSAIDDVESLEDRPHTEFDFRSAHHCIFWDIVHDAGL